jgi:hypothetical protein
MAVAANQNESGGTVAANRPTGGGTVWPARSRSRSGQVQTIDVSSLFSRIFDSGAAATMTANDGSAGGMGA